MNQEEDEVGPVEPEVLIARLHDRSPRHHRGLVLDLLGHLHYNDLELRPDYEENLDIVSDRNRVISDG